MVLEDYTLKHVWGPQIQTPIKAPVAGSLVFGEFAFLPFSVGPPGDCPWRHYGERESWLP